MSQKAGPRSARPFESTSRRRGFRGQRWGLERNRGQWDVLRRVASNPSPGGVSGSPDYAGVFHHESEGDVGAAIGCHLRAIGGHGIAGWFRPAVARFPLRSQRREPSGRREEGWPSVCGIATRGAGPEGFEACGSADPRRAPVHSLAASPIMAVVCCIGISGAVVVSSIMVAF